jgi:predicted dehydrogenase
MIRLAIVGTGGMARTHAREFAAIKGVQLAACCDVDGGRARDFATTFHIPHSFHDFTEMLDGADFDAVTNVTPDAYHARLSIEACARGKHVFCEKPLATNHADAAKMARAAADADVVNMVNFSYRNSAALQHAARRIARGDLGRIFHVQAHYLQSWLTSREWGDWHTGEKWLWRLSTLHGSKGVLGDVGVHILDFASFPVAEIASVNCLLRTFDKAPRNRIKDYSLDANDSAVVTVQYANGAVGAVQTTRLATGHVNSLLLSIHGEKGAFRIDLDRSYSDYEECFVRKSDGKTDPWKTVTAPAVPTLYQRFIRSINTGKNDQPDFARGARIQQALDACEKSHATGRTISLKPQ